MNVSESQLWAWVVLEKAATVAVDADRDFFFFGSLER